jgi:hypothetical protein
MRNPKTRGDAAFRLAVAQRGPGLGLLLDILSFLHTRKCLKMSGIISLWKNGWLVKDCIWAIICDFSGYVFVIVERKCRNRSNNIELAILFKFGVVFEVMID